MQISKQLMKHLVNEHGADQRRWPEALRNLVDPKIEARSVSPPISGKVAAFLDTNYHYHWAFDRCGVSQDHERVESMRYAGWEFATTDDVKMASENAVIGRKKRFSGQKEKQQEIPSRDGGEGWSDEIRSGDRRLMKLPMFLWKQNEKAALLASYQMAYPQAYGNQGQPMTAGALIPGAGVSTEMMDEGEIAEARRSATPGNSVSIPVRTGKET